MSNRFFAVYELPVRYGLMFYCKNKGSLVTEDFSEATILDDTDSFWELLKNPRINNFKVHQANEKDIFKWQLKNEVPRERL